MAGHFTLTEYYLSIKITS